MTELEWLVFLWVAIAICALCLAGMAYCTYQIQKYKNSAAVMTRSGTGCGGRNEDAQGNITNQN